MSDSLLGVRWVRALMHDPEVQRDFETWLAAYRAMVLDSLASEDDAMKLHRLQGQLRAVDEIDAFIEAAMKQSGETDKSSANGEE